MDGSDDVESVLENLAGAGVDHGPLNMELVFETEIGFEPGPGGKLTRVGVSLGTQEMKIILLLGE